MRMRALLVALFISLCVTGIHAQDAAEVTGAESEPGARKGFFTISLTVLELLGEQGATSVAEIFAPDELLEWQLYVPDSYDANAPSGAIVYVSPWEGGGPPKSWNDLMQEKNLIWIGAQNSGNDVAVSRRMFLAMFAPTVLQQHYALDAERMYLAGFSGGAKTACRVAVLRPNLFKGAIFMSGAMYWGRKSPALLSDIVTRHYVFMSGSNDFGLAESKSVQRKFLAAGVENSKLIVIRNHRHKLPEPEYFAQAVEYLDSRVSE